MSAHRLTIDIFSDVMCPWCVIGYKQLERALDGLAGEIEAEIRWRPFELNPDMPPEGEEMAAHMLRKYGRVPDAAATGQMTAMAERAGYAMRYLGAKPEPERRLWNTFLTHKLLRWALVTAGPEAQMRLKLALFDANFQQRRDVSDRAVLLAIAESAGLDRAGAEAAFDDDAIGQEVRIEEQEAMQNEITGVPAMLINGKYLIPGAQEAEAYARILRRVVEREG